MPHEKITTIDELARMLANGFNTVKKDALETEGRLREEIKALDSRLSTQIKDVDKRLSTIEYRIFAFKQSH